MWLMSLRHDWYKGREISTNWSSILIPNFDFGELIRCGEFVRSKDADDVVLSFFGIVLIVREADLQVQSTLF